MKKLITLALTATFVFLTQQSFSQSIVLINGVATDVTLSGSDIISSTANTVEGYMSDFEQAPNDTFIKTAAREKQLMVVNTVLVEPAIVTKNKSQRNQTYVSSAAEAAGSFLEE